MAIQQHHHILLQCLALVLMGTCLHAHTVRVQPRELFVELGSAFNLSCSTDCPRGHASWVTLDDSDFTTTEDRQGVLLSVLSTHEHHAGDYVCISQCKQQHKKTSARLHVFSFPDPVLSMAPLNPVSGQSVQVNCTVSVYCSDNYKVDIKLFGEDELSGPMHTFCDQSNSCNHTLSATDRRGRERVNYICLAEFTVSMHTLSKTANMTIQFQDIRKMDSTWYTTPTMASLTSTAATSVEAITETSPGESSTSVPFDYRDDPNAVKAVEPVSRLTTSIIGSTGALLFSAMGIVIYACKYGRKLPCLGSARRKENTNELKEVS
ncbi:vesicle transport protein USE1 isoform X1 [Sardina pilchardus]|uniref:vesicle transport protein USE1 isoform X1 n=1 Tax=Sardina pilchardus TaxID=27697 RepID=UPI002E133491